MGEGRQSQENHRFVMCNRGDIELTGIQDVKEFDDKELHLLTSQGVLHIRGSELHIKNLDVEKGDMAISGKVDQITYSGSRTWKKLGIFS